MQKHSNNAVSGTLKVHQEIIFTLSNLTNLSIRREVCLLTVLFIVKNVVLVNQYSKKELK